MELIGYFYKSMTLNQLRFAVSVARTGSFTAAAAECSVTQPTLSSAVAQLEHELGQKLFIRTTRKVGMTAFGAHIISDLQRVLDAEDAVYQRARAYLSPQHPLIRIGISPLLNTRFLNLLLEPYRKEHTHIDLVLREMNMEDLRRLLNAEQLDFVFGVASLDKGNREHAFLYRENLHYVPRGGQPIKSKGKGTISLKEVADETFVMVPNACGLTQATRNLFRAHRHSLREYSGEAMSYQVLEQWALLGIGAAILPASKLMDKSIASYRLVDGKSRQLILEFEATYHSAIRKMPHLQGFADYLKEVIPSLSSGLYRQPQ